jgi:hypothetical protein
MPEFGHRISCINVCASKRQKKGMNEDELNTQLDPQASSDQITTQILTPTMAGISTRRGQGAQDTAIPEALITGAALVLILVTEPWLLHRRSKIPQTTLPRHLNPQITTPRPIYKSDNEHLKNN